MIARLILLLALPSAAMADWSARPSHFSYGPALTACREAQTDPARACDAALASAYALRREITYALLPCILGEAEDCAARLEEAGLPGAPLTELRQAGCMISANGVPELDPSGVPSRERMPGVHCVERLARVIETEPLLTTHNTSIACGVIWIECGELAVLNAEYWFDRSTHLLEAHRYNTRNTPTPTRWLTQAEQTLEEATTLCETAGSGGWAEDLERIECATQIYAILAQDLYGRLPTSE